MRVVAGVRDEGRNRKQRGRKGREFVTFWGFYAAGRSTAKRGSSASVRETFISFNRNMVALGSLKKPFPVRTSPNFAEFLKLRLISYLSACVSIYLVVDLIAQRIFFSFFISSVTENIRVS